MVNKIFVALNADDVGQKIGSTVLSDNHEELARISSSIKNAHDMIDKWVVSNGGKIVASSGDENIFMIPSHMLSRLDEIKSKYQESTGHSLTVGTGSSLSEASKALIYGKLHEKGQTVNYESSMDDYLSDSGESEEEDEDLGWDDEEASNNESHTDNIENEQSEDESGDIESFENDGERSEETSELDPNESGIDNEDEMEDELDEQDGEQDEDEDLEGEDFSEEEIDDEYEEDLSSDDSDNDGDNFGFENEDSEEEEESDEELEDEEDEESDIDDNFEDEEELEDSEDSEDSEDLEDETLEYEDDSYEDEEDLDEDLDGDEVDEEDLDSEDSEEDFEDESEDEEFEDEYQDDDLDEEDENAFDEDSEEEMDDEDLDPEYDENQPDHEIGMDDEEDAIHDSIENQEDEMDEDDIEADEEENHPELQDGQDGDKQNMIMDMLHANLNSDSGMDKDMIPQDQQSLESMREEILDSLMAFKQNKDFLEQAKESNPSLYQGLVAVLRNMIEMAKQLNLNPEKDMQDLSNQQQFEEEFPENGEINDDESQYVENPRVRKSEKK